MIKKLASVFLLGFFPVFSLFGMDDDFFDEQHEKTGLISKHIVSQEPPSYGTSIIPEDKIDSKFFKWVSEEVFSSDNVHTSSKKLKVFSFVSGTLGSIVFYDLGYEFGAQHNEGTGIFLGLVSSTPVAIMGSRFVEHIFSEMISSFSTKSPLQKSIMRKGRDYSDFGLYLVRGVEGFIGIISATPFSYRSFQDWAPKLTKAGASILFVTPTFYVKAIADVWALEALRTEFLDEIKQGIYEHISPDSLFYKKQCLLRELKATLNFIDQLSDDEAKELINHWKAKNLTREHSNEGKEIVKDILGFQNYCRKKNIRIVRTEEPWQRKLFRLAGAAVGAISMAAIEPLAQESMDSTLTEIDMYNPEESTAFSWGATVAAASLMSYTTADSFGKFYDFLSYLKNKFFYKKRNYESLQNTDENPVSERYVNRSTFINREEESSRINKIVSFFKKREVIAGFSCVVGAAAAIPNVQLSLDYLGTDTPFHKFALACAFISPFSMNFWAIDEALLSLKGINDLRAEPKLKVRYIFENLDKFHPEIIECLFKIFQENNQATASKE